MHTKSNLMQNQLTSIRCTRPDPREVNQHFHWLISVHILHLPLTIPLDITVVLGLLGLLGLLCVGPLQGTHQGTLLGPPLQEYR